MEKGNALATITGYLRTLPGQLSSTTSSLAALAGHPALLREWLASSWPVIAMLAALIAFGLWLLPGMAQGLADWLFPAVSQEHLFGIIRTEEADPRNATAYRAMLWIYWLVLAGAAVVLLARSLQPTLAAAREKAHALLRDARALMEHNPERSLALLNQAMTLAAGPAVRESVKDERRNLTQWLSTGGDGTMAASAATAIGVQIPQSRPVDDDGRYVATDELGRGAMGVVYRGRDTLLDRPVAIKALPQSTAATADLAERFRQEARAAARLTHPGIVQVYDFVASGSGNYIVLELVTGQSLERYLNANAPMAVDHALALSIPLAEALGAAHDSGIVHRDFKPGNVLLGRDERPKIADFGLAKVTGSSMATVVGSVLGSPGYMSPEQAAGAPADHRSDMYAFGIVVYHMLTGAPPFQGATASVLSQQITAAPKPLTDLRKDVPEELASTVATLLAKDADARFDTMAAVTQRLRDIAQPRAAD
ncbi:serine/threonine protein kinase [Ectothiorhodospiraceae bacterium WFHF3C12]|nr:serine/threonine protein kinase [Ectothiorhodospiraceae bacterium WFHF3C12]